MMWIGTAKGILKLKHIPTLSTSFKGELKTDGKSIDETYVLAITYVEKASSVLVSTNASEIWAFSDMLTPEGLVIEERIRLQPELNCYQLIVVEVRGSLEVWGTMDNSQLILFQKHGKGWMMGGPYKVKCRQNWQFYHIAHAAFEDQKGDTHNHLWVPYWKKGSIVCWDLQKRQHRTTLDTSALKSCKSSTHCTHTFTILPFYMECNFFFKLQQQYSFFLFFQVLKEIIYIPKLLHL